METSILVILGVAGLIVLPFVLAILMFRPLVISIADRIAGRKVANNEIKEIKQKLYLLQDEVADLRGKMLVLEDEYEFSQRLLKDIEKRSIESKPD
ncbi:MAG: hypothetical protein K2X93_03270 [Candidatus Obscuribacterales bacterium]|nr:hypothetical protein [Candidatus Obscuribacterales bacterium]